MAHLVSVRYRCSSTEMEEDFEISILRVLSQFRLINPGSSRWYVRYISHRLSADRASSSYTSIATGNAIIISAYSIFRSDDSRLILKSETCWKNSEVIRWLAIYPRYSTLRAKSKLQFPNWNEIRIFAEDADKFSGWTALGAMSQPILIFYRVETRRWARRRRWAFWRANAITLWYVYRFQTTTALCPS